MSEKIDEKKISGASSGQLHPFSPSGLAESAKEGLWSANPVLLSALGICFVAAVGVELPAAVALSIITVLVTVAVTALFSFVGKWITVTYRYVLYIAFSALLVMPAALLVQRFDPEVFSQLGIYIPLTAVNSLIASRAEGAVMRKSFLAPVRDAFFSSLGFSLVLCLVAILRTALMTGTLFGISFTNFMIPTAKLPFAGFMLVALLAAFQRWLSVKIKKIRISKRG